MERDAALVCEFEDKTVVMNARNTDIDRLLQFTNGWASQSKGRTDLAKISLRPGRL